MATAELDNTNHIIKFSQDNIFPVQLNNAEILTQQPYYMLCDFKVIQNIASYDPKDPADAYYRTKQNRISELTRLINMSDTFSPKLMEDLLNVTSAEEFSAWREAGLADYSEIIAQRKAARQELKEIYDEIERRKIKTPKAVLAGSVLTFYYDKDDHAEEGTVFEVDDGTNHPWTNETICETITEIKSDSSFIEYDGITTMSEYFIGCKNVTKIDLSNFFMANVDNTMQTFRGCKSLNTIYVSSDYTSENIVFSDWMFYGCSGSLKGQGGTRWREKNLQDKTYACIDNPPTTPGYFTAKQ